MRILFITDRSPYPPVSGNLLRTFNICQRIAREHEVWLAMPLNNPKEAEGMLHMQQLCYQVLSARRRQYTPLQHLPGLLSYALEGKPWEFKFEYCDELVQKIQHISTIVDFDIVHIEPSYMGLYIEALSPVAHCKTFLTFHNIESSLFRRLAGTQRSPLKKARAGMHSLMLRRWESSYTERFSHCITVSEEDRSLLLTRNPNLAVSVSPNGCDTKTYNPLAPQSGSKDLMFVGTMSYMACVDAALFFCHEILPFIREQVTGVETWIVGRDPLPQVQQLDGDDIHVTGWVNDVIPYYRRSAVCVVPLRAGGGTRLKILEAMALGRPVVSTTIGCEGLDVVDGEHLLIADTPEQFAAKTVALLTDSSLWHRITLNARKLVVTSYDWDAITKKLLEIYAAVAGETVDTIRPHPIRKKIV